MIHNNLLAAIITCALAFIWLRFMDFCASRGWISGKLSRKIIHIGTGPLFVICWILFDQAYYARYLAAIVPLITTIQFFLVGMGWMKDEAAVQAMSRSGDRREILRGPLIYGIAFVILTVIFWKDSLYGIVALMVLCGGDGLADVIGKQFPTFKLPWSDLKTWAGSLAMLVGSFLLSWLIVYVFNYAGIFAIQWESFLPRLGIICIAATLVESIPVRDIDNVTVPVTAILLGLLLF
jgi:phytol kinase